MVLGVAWEQYRHMCYDHVDDVFIATYTTPHIHNVTYINAAIFSYVWFVWSLLWLPPVVIRHTLTYMYTHAQVRRPVSTVFELLLPTLSVLLLVGLR